MVFERAVSIYGLNRAVSDTLEEILEILDSAWSEASTVARKNAIKALKDSSTVEAGIVAMLASLKKDLGSGIVSKKQILAIRSITRDAYSAIKAKTASGLGSGMGDMIDLDYRLAKKLGNDGPYWIGKFYNRELSGRISEVAKDAVTSKGLGRNEAARVMDSTLKQEFSLFGGKSNYASEVPGQFAGNLHDYNKILTSNVAGRSRNFGFLTAMGEASVERFRFTAVMDERTSEVCQEMDGREFSVSYAVSRLEEIAESDNPEAFKDLAPWPKDVNQLLAIAGTGSQAEQNSRLEAAGFQFPPLHGKCRSLVEQVL